MTTALDIGWIGLDGPAPSAVHGEKAVLLAKAAAEGLDVPPGFVLPPDWGGDLGPALAKLEAAAGARLGDAEAPLLIAVRPAACMAAGGIAPAILNVGVTRETLSALAARLGACAALNLQRRLIHLYGTTALHLEGEEFEYALHDMLRLAGVDSETDLNAAQLEELVTTSLRLVDEAGESFPDDARAQLDGAIAALPQVWGSRRARLRRQALDVDPDASLALMVQIMALGIGRDHSGAGFADLRSEATGAPCLTGRYLAQAQGEDALMGLRTPMVLTSKERRERGLRASALEELAPDVIPALREAGAKLEAAIGDAVSLEFTVESGRVKILEVKRAKRTARAAVRIAVDLAEGGIIERDAALMRIDPGHLEEQLHPAVDPAARRTLLGTGLPASPGAASGPLAFSPDAAEAAAARGEQAILALIETSPEDIRGMHAAAGVLTVRGGMTSHAAVVARGLGKPCVVGARDLALEAAEGQLRTADGAALSAGTVVTVDGTAGQILDGRMPMIQPEATGAFATLLAWADAARRMDVRVNADTGPDARIAEAFGAKGIGLCRTEHMFFQRGRITAMREMILAETVDERKAALEKLLPMQRDDFVELFQAMPGRPVTVRLLDPPLHEFLPHGEGEMRDMAASLDVPVSKVETRADELAEFNPMLGKRGCRIGIAYPEIYEMQARAIFEAAIKAARITGSPVRPEVMIPLVSAVREIDVLKGHIDRIAALVNEIESDMVDYTVGVMIETPRACLRAADIAATCGFLSFGTNDLTQMLYGLSRDDAGRFMHDYVAGAVFAHDPFHSLDVEGVGEMIRIAIERARRRDPTISLGLCGEHGGDPASVDFCERAGLDYVSCSPYRVPVARLAGAQAAIRARGTAPKGWPAGGTSAPPVGTALESLRSGGKRALADALTRIESTPDAPEIAALLDAAFAEPRGVALGLTGPPGVGKSTLVDALIRAWRATGRTAGVIAVDPSSARSQGALLGDRTRLSIDPADPGVFVRSMAARDRLGGIAEPTFPAIVLMRALFDLVLVETVGVGQSETAIARAADLIAVCAQPGSGDALQYMKAGIMEIPDLVIVTKTDLGALAGRTIGDLKGALSLTGAVPVLGVSAIDGAGLDALVQEIRERAAAFPPHPNRPRERQALQWIEDQISTRFGAEGLKFVRGRLGDDIGASPFGCVSAWTERLTERLTLAAAEASAPL